MVDQLAKVNFSAIGGMETAAIPISVIVANKFQKRLGMIKRPFYIRKEQKDHGLKSIIEGHIDPCSNIVLVEDVVSTGGSLLQCVDALQAHQHKIVKIFGIVDRNLGGQENLKDYNYEWLLSIEEILKWNTVAI